MREYEINQIKYLSSMVFVEWCLLYLCALHIGTNKKKHTHMQTYYFTNSYTHTSTDMGRKVCPMLLMLMMMMMC